MIPWPLALTAHEREIVGPEDDIDFEVNGDPDSLTGEEDETGFDESPLDVGWEDDDEDDDDEDE